MRTNRVSVVLGEWQREANCLGMEGDLFFPERGADAAAALEVCRGCVVRWECLEHALANGEDHGVWGGMVASERRAIRQGRRRLRPVSEPYPPR